jgi:hypothetical protein
MLSLTSFQGCRDRLAAARSFDGQCSACTRTAIGINLTYPTGKVSLSALLMTARVAPPLAAGRANPKMLFTVVSHLCVRLKGLVRLISDLRQVRRVIGRPLCAHGAQKMLGWFGEPGFSGTVSKLAKFGMPSTVTLFAILQSLLKV